MMPELLVEQSGVRYVHWGVVLAMAVLMVLWFLKCGYPWSEGFSQPFNGEQNAVASNANKMALVGAWSGSAGPNRTIPSDTSLSPSVSRMGTLDGAYMMGNRPDFGPSMAQTLAQQKSGFLNGPQSPWVPAPETKYTAHNYMKAVHDTADQNAVSGFIGGLEAWELEGAVGGRGGDFSSRGPPEGKLGSLLGN